MANITLKKFTVEFKKRKKIIATAVDNVDATFLDGHISVLMGDSGCGKTSVLRGIIGLIDHKGDLLFDDINVNEYGIADKGLSYVSQSLGLYPHMTVFNNIAYPLRTGGSDAKEIRGRVNEVAKMLHIEACLTRKPRHISLGQAQRVAIARAIIKRPILYLLDEPFSNLDRKLTLELIPEFKKIFKELHATVIFVTHDIEEAMLLGDDIYYMEEGKIKESFVPASKITKSKNKTIQTYLESIWTYTNKKN